MAKSQDEILAEVKAGKLNVEEASKQLAELAATTKAKLYCKVSVKGAISVYGLQRMPVTLYVQQWERLLAFAEQLRAFAKEHDKELSRK